MTRKLLLPLLAAAALALPAAAAAHSSHHHHALFARLSGTGASFAANSATANGTITSLKLGTGTFAASIATTWAGAQTHTGDRGTLACAPATATLTLTGATSTNTVTAHLTGRTCKFTPASGTGTVSMFMGRDAKLTATGTVAGLNGTAEKAFLVQKADGSVHGAVFAGLDTRMSRLFAFGEHLAARHTGDCDGDH